MPPVNRHLMSIRAYPLPTFILAAWLMFFGLGLILQPERWSSTPAYVNLLILLSAQAWGIVHLVMSAGVWAALFFRRIRAIAVTVHIVIFLLVLFWEVAFFVRWSTDTNTTVANVLNWLLLISLVGLSAILINEDDPKDPKALVS